MSERRFANVCEVFGPTVQGEGVHTGMRVGFVRFAGCNLSCSWCDTPYSWDWTRFNRSEEVTKMQTADIANAIVKMEVDRIVCTGGEPMLQQSIIVDLWKTLGIAIDVETNGTIAPSEACIKAVDLFCVSPKLSHSGDDYDARIVDGALSIFAELAWEGNAFFKFVARTPADLIEVQNIVNVYHIPHSAVWVMGEGATIDAHVASTQAIADAVVEYGWNLSTRLHVLAWETERGH